MLLPGVNGDPVISALLHHRPTIAWLGRQVGPQGSTKCCEGNSHRYYVVTRHHALAPIEEYPVIKMRFGFKRD